MTSELGLEPKQPKPSWTLQKSVCASAFRRELETTPDKLVRSVMVTYNKNQEDKHKTLKNITNICLYKQPTRTSFSNKHLQQSIN